MRFINYIKYFVVISMVASCADNLDLQPEQSLSPEVVISNSANIQNLLVGIYDEAGQADCYGGDLNLGVELLADVDDLSWNGTFEDPATFKEKQLVSFNAFIRDYWLNGYEVSNQANLVLSSLKNVDNDEQDRIEGEAKFLRALIYFDLARLFGLPYEAGQVNSQLAVPIVTNAIRNSTQIEFPARNTVEEVYDFVISDLTEAYALLPADNDIYANKYAAMALLARVYLQQGDFIKAREAANDVIENSGFVLNSDFASAFNNAENSVEDIFAWQITSQDGANDMNLFWSGRDFGGRSGNPDISISEPHFTIYDDVNDERSLFFYENSGGTATTKWQSQFANIPFIRIAEIHLIRVESNFREATAVGLTPQEEINALRARSNAAPLVNLSLQDILDERKRELAFEGFSLHDIKRVKGNVGTLPYNDPKLVMPIPLREMDANPNLEQNPGYN